MSAFNAIIPSPIGHLGIQTADDKLSGIHFLGESYKPEATKDAYTQYVIEELQAYFTNPKHIFKLDLDIHGTNYQQKVWQAIAEIPSGQTLQYKELAFLIDSGPRAVGNACGANRIPIVIPCHRIVAKNNLGGFGGRAARGGYWASIKKWLLQHEV